MNRQIILLCVFLGLFFHSPSVPAQMMPQELSFKSSLADFLYQYGKELYNRGIDLQEASFVFQRALVLNCHHQGAQAFLNKLHEKYPDVSIRIWGCSEDQDEKMVSEAVSTPENTDLPDGKMVQNQPQKEAIPQAQGFQVVDDDENSTAGQLNDHCQKFEDQIKVLEKVIKQKDIEIERYKKLGSEKAVMDPKAASDASFSSIAQDQRNLIRVQQSNIDYLKSELADLKKQSPASSTNKTETEYAKAQRQVAGSGLEMQETKIKLESKNQEIQTLQQKLADLQEELKLVQKIIDEKNKMIESLQTGSKQ